MKREFLNVKGFIYKILSPNGKVYIGQTINLKKRKSYYKTNNFKQQIKLWNNCKFYNWKPLENFEVIEECLCGINKENLNKREKYWIKYFKSFKNGLNCNEGGNGNVGHKHSDETKKKISKALLGVKHPEWRNKQKSKYTKGRRHTVKSKNKISETKQKNMNDKTKNLISEGLKGNKNGIGNKGGSKQIICLSNGFIYSSIKKAAIVLGLHEANISYVCKGKYKQTGGYKFKYYE